MVTRQTRYQKPVQRQYSQVFQTFIIFLSELKYNCKTLKLGTSESHEKNNDINIIELERQTFLDRNAKILCALALFLLASVAVCCFCFAYNRKDRRQNNNTDNAMSFPPAPESSFPLV